MLLLLAVLLGAPEAPVSQAPEAPLSQGMMAVLELRNRLPPGDNVDRGYFSDRIRQAALRALPDLRLMTRENMEVIAKSLGVDLADCEGECEVVTGRKLGADSVVSGELSRLGSQYKLTLRLHSTREGRLLSVGQASGASLEELDRDLDQATSELLAPLTGARRTTAPAARKAPAGPPRPYWPWMWERDRFQLSGGYSGSPGLGKGAHVMVRLFGLEAHYFGLGTGDYLTGLPNSSPALSWTYTGFAFGISPISIATNRGDPASFGFQWFEPFLLYRTGTVSVAGDPDFTQAGIQAGNRFAFDIPLFGPWRLRPGLDVAVDTVTSDGGHPVSSGSTHFFGTLWIGLGYSSF